MQRKSATRTWQIIGALLILLSTLVIVGSHLEPVRAESSVTGHDHSSKQTSSNPQNIVPPPCSTIPLIQGSGFSSPCAGEVVTNVKGCITGVSSKGFYYQAILGDGNPQTSDGLYVNMLTKFEENNRGYYWPNTQKLKLGDKVLVTGKAGEYYGATAIQRIADEERPVVEKIGTCTLPDPVAVEPLFSPYQDPDYAYERYESMYVKMSFDGWVIGATKVFHSIHGDPEIAFVDYRSSIPDDKRIYHDDYTYNRGINYLNGGFNIDLPDPDFGDKIAGTEIPGVLGYGYRKWRLLPNEPVTLTTEDMPDVPHSRPEIAPGNVGFDICFFNTENLFDHLYRPLDPGGGNEPNIPDDFTPRDEAGYQERLDEVAEVLVNDMGSCAVIGLQEVENNQAVYNALAQKVTELDGSHSWSAGFAMNYEPEHNITQGFLWRDDVTILDGGVKRVAGSPYEEWSYNGLDFVRPPAHGRFLFHAGTLHEVAVNVFSVHFKSGGSPPERPREAMDMEAILTHYQENGEYAVAGGDFNDTMDSGSLQWLENSENVHDLFEDLDEEEWWTYVYNGMSEVLDHIYITQNLRESGWDISFNPVHTQADFPDSERASDHDPLVAVFQSEPCSINVEIDEPHDGSHFRPGTRFNFLIDVEHTCSHEIKRCPTFVVLQAPNPSEYYVPPSEYYYFWPSWTPDQPPDHKIIVYRNQGRTIRPIQPFYWPEGLGTGHSCLHTSVTTSDFQQIEGATDSVCFRWNEGKGQWEEKPDPRSPKETQEALEKILQQQQQKSDNHITPTKPRDLMQDPIHHLLKLLREASAHWLEWIQPNP